MIRLRESLFIIRLIKFLRLVFFRLVNFVREIVRYGGACYVRKSGDLETMAYPH